VRNWYQEGLGKKGVRKGEMKGAGCLTGNRVRGGEKQKLGGEEAYWGLSQKKEEEDI